MWQDLMSQAAQKKDSCISGKTDCSEKAKKQRYYFSYQGRPFYLTSREAEAASMLLLGKTLVGIAEATQLSMRTVEYYLNNIKKKLHCRTRQELIVKLAVCELIEKKSGSSSRGIFV